MTKYIRLKKLLVGIIATSLLYIFPIFAIASNEGKFAKIINRDQKGNFVGFTDYGKKIIEDTRNALINRKKAAQKEFRQFESIYHAAHVIRGIKGNLFLYGPPGGSKSRFLNWFLDHEQEPAFKIQLHQMMTEMALIGGQMYENAKLGVYKLNTEGSLARYKTALIDEIDKGNPATLASLLSLLNERVVQSGSEVFNSPLETVFSTSNKNLYKIYEVFKNQLEDTTAEAIFNRFSCIAFAPNWLGEEDQDAIDEKYRQEREQAYYGEFNTPQEQIDESSLHLNWDNLRLLAQVFFRTTKEFDQDAKNLANTLRTFTSRFDCDTVDDQMRKPSERQREKIKDIIFMSLTLDFLTSSLTAKDKIKELEATLKNTQGNRFVLMPYSLWRAYIYYTTVSFGVTKLKKKEIPTADEPGVEIDFGDFLEKYKEGAECHNKQMVKYTIHEQQAFKEVLEKVWSASASLASSAKNDGTTKIDIEALLLKSQDAG